ncbi:MAG: PAS domain S-box protein [Candidatus Methanoperedens sp.]|nr:PAS domain S-box protein [Candidatus Methanoperedens sp.]
MKDKDKTKEQLMNELVELRQSITGLKELEAKQKQVDEEIRLLLTLTRAIGESEDLKVALEIALKKVCEATGWDYGEAWIPNVDGTVLELSPVWYSSSGSLDNFRRVSEKFTFQNGIGLPGRIWLSKLPEWIPDVSLSPNTIYPRVQMAREAGLKASLGVPIIAKEQILAVLLFFMLESREKDKQLVDIVSAVASQLGSVIQHKQADEDIRKEKNFSDTAINSLPGIFYLFDNQDRFLRWNENFEKFSGYSAEEISKMNPLDFFVGEDRKFIEQKIQEVFAKGRSTAEADFVSKDGHRTPYLFTGTRVTFDQTQCLLGMGISIAERKQAEEELRKAEAKYRSIFENAIEGIYQTTLDGRIISANPAFARTLGYTSPHELIAEVANVRKLYVDPSRRDELISLIHTQGFVENFEVQFYCKDGKIVWFLLNTRILRDSSGIVCFEGTATDITDRKRAGEEILKLNRELEQHIIQLGEANKELEAFSYSVSHDLRAPLRAIDGFSNIFLKKHEDKLDEEGKRVLNIIRINTQKMGELIDNLLTLSRLGRKEMVLSDINMCELAKDVYEELRATVPGRILQFNIKSLPVAIGDIKLIRQVFVNLLANAIKFTRSREIAVIEVRGRSEKNEIIYYVKDNGAGFDMQYSDQLFGVFQRLHSEKEFEGTGVGLAIIQRIIHRHGGRVWAEGKVDEGATFYFTLPIKEKV